MQSGRQPSYRRRGVSALTSEVGTRLAKRVRLSLRTASGSRWCRRTPSRRSRCCCSHAGWARSNQALHIATAESADRARGAIDDAVSAEKPPIGDSAIGDCCGGGSGGGGDSGASAVCLRCHCDSRPSHSSLTKHTCSDFLDVLNCLQAGIWHIWADDGQTMLEPFLNARTHAGE